MKALKNLTATIQDGKITIVGDIADYTPQQKIQQVTIGNMSPHNMSFVRHCQLSHEAFFTSQMNNGVCLMLDDWMKIMVQVEPKLASYPTFVKMPTKADLKAIVDSETPVQFQWCGSNDGKSFKIIDGQTTDTLSNTDYKFVVVSVKNATGQTDSDLIVLK